MLWLLKENEGLFHEKSFVRERTRQLWKVIYGYKMTWNFKKSFLKFYIYEAFPEIADSIAYIFQDLLYSDRELFVLNC